MRQVTRLVTKCPNLAAYAKRDGARVFGPSRIGVWHIYLGGEEMTIKGPVFEAGQTVATIGGPNKTLTGGEQ